MHQSMYAQGNNIVAFIKVQGIQIRNKLITFNLMICMQIFPFLGRYRYYHGNCKTHTAKKKIIKKKPVARIYCRMLKRISSEKRLYPADRAEVL